MTQLLTASEAARLAVVSTDTVRRAFDSGDLAGLRTAGGLRLFERGSVEAYARDRAERRAAKRKGRAL